MSILFLIFSIAVLYWVFLFIKELWEKIKEVESRLMEINKILDGIRRRIG